MEFADLLNTWLDNHPPEPKDEHETDDKQLRQQAAIERSLLRRRRPQATLDLHGLTAVEALERAERFLAESKALGLQKVLIIHGKGNHTLGGEAVLRDVIRTYLRTHPLTGEMGVPDRAMGGEGAVWVLLR
jgi:DNA-nicking Smr family endonuclease